MIGAPRVPQHPSTHGKMTTLPLTYLDHLLMAIFTHKEVKSDKMDIKANNSNQPKNCNQFVTVHEYEFCNQL